VFGHLGVRRRGRRGMADPFLSLLTCHAIGRQIVSCRDSWRHATMKEPIFYPPEILSYARDELTADLAFTMDPSIDPT